jgi:pimeloyl-ACP methyl ester carboxylesterase
MCPLKTRLAAIVGVLAGCASGPVTQEGARPDTADVVDFYWEYAALAADVYLSHGSVDTRIGMALASPWLRAEVGSSGKLGVQEQFNELNANSATLLYRARVKERCPDSNVDDMVDAADSAVRLTESRCITAEEAQTDARLKQELAASEPNTYVAKEPMGPEDCEFGRGKQPLVPIDSAMHQFKWERVPELHRQTAARAWSIFVPDLAIDVWRRRRLDENGTVEYAVVYRGTVGGGGWVSNLRAVTFFTPFIWDQYRQAQQATVDIVDQAHQLHAISDALFQRAQPTRLKFTAVGHSLGAGLAKYIYLRVPQITRVVGFDPSPIDGSATLPIDKRADVMNERRRDVDRHGLDPTASMFLLYEHGEIMGRVAPCFSGPLWGAEGGPQVRCHVVNFSSGNPFRQHNMAQLACKLSLARRGLPVRRD